MSLISVDNDLRYPIQCLVHWNKMGCPKEEYDTRGNGKVHGGYFCVLGRNSKIASYILNGVNTNLES